MAADKRARGRPADPHLDGKIEITLALEQILQCSTIEAARMVAQADPELLAVALEAKPVHADQALEAIMRGAFGISRDRAEADAATAHTVAARDFPSPENRQLSPDGARRRMARFRKVLGANAEAARQQQPRALDVERGAQAILQGLKNRRARHAVDTELVNALQRALVAFDEHEDSSDPWTLG